MKGTINKVDVVKENKDSISYRGSLPVTMIIITSTVIKNSEIHICLCQVIYYACIFMFTYTLNAHFSLLLTCHLISLFAFPYLLC
jgi:hypothetical protein